MKKILFLKRHIKKIHHKGFIWSKVFVDLIFINLISFVRTFKSDPVGLLSLTVTDKKPRVSDKNTRNVKKNSFIVDKNPHGLDTNPSHVDDNPRVQIKIRTN